MRLCKLAVCAVLALGLVARAQEGDDLAGTMGDLQHARFEGCKLISADDVRRALSMDTRVQVLTSPSAPLAALLSMIDTQLNEAYRGAGFPNAHVSAGPDAGGRNLLIQIDEGSRYIAGPVRVDGGHLVDPKDLIAVLTESSATAQAPAHIDAQHGTIVILTWEKPDDLADPSWVPGKPAHLAYERLSDDEDRVEAALCAQGFCWAHMHLEQTLQSDGTAQMVIHIADEGPKAVLADVKVLGLKINTPQDVMKLAGLQPGMPVTLQTLRDVRRKLWDSGRFLKHEIRADVSPQDPGHMRLTLDMMEHPSAPPLNEPLAGAQAAAVRCAQWVQQAMDGDGAFVVSADEGPGSQAKLVVQNRRGAVVSFRTDGTRLPASTEPVATQAPVPIDWRLGAIRGPSTNVSGLTWAGGAWDMTVVLVPQRPTIYSLIAGHTLALSGRFPIKLQCDIVPEEDPASVKSENLISLRLGFGLYSPTGGADPVKFECTMAPVAFLDFASVRDRSAPDAPTVQAQTKDGVMTITSGHRVLRTELATGRLVDLTLTASIRIWVEPDGLDRTAAAALAAAPKANDYDHNHPFTSAVEFFKAWQAKCPVIVWNWPHSPSPAASAVLAKLLAAQILGPLDALQWGGSDEASDFYTRGSPPGSMLGLLRNYLCLVDQIYPHGSWPWTIGHETLMCVSGPSPFVGRELDRVVNSPDTGPIGCAALAAIVGIKDPDAARAIAAAGCKRLTGDFFRSDWRVLVQGDGIGPQIAARLLQSIADLSDADFAALRPMLSPAWIDALQYVRQVGKDQPKLSVATALGQAPEKWWDQALYKPVEELLHRQAQQP